MTRALLALALTSTLGCGGGAAASGGAQAPAPAPSGDVEARLRRLEEESARNAEALAFLRKVYDAQRVQAEEEAASEPDPDAVFAVPIAADVKLGKVDGPPTAAVTIVKGFDFACPYCEKTAETMEQLVAQYAGQVRVVFKDYVVHPDVALDAHHAACAAAKQGKYKPYKQLVWRDGFLAYAASRDRSKLAVANLTALAKAAGLDLKRFAADMAGAECAASVRQDMADLEAFRVTGTPVFFINGKMIQGALPSDAFSALIDEQLAVVKASGVPAAAYYDQVVLAKGEKTFRSIADRDAAAGGR